MSHYFDKLASQWDQNPMKVERATATAEKIKAIPFTSRTSLVDFGSGTGLLGVQLKDTFESIHLVDASAEMLKAAQTKIASAGLSNIHTHQLNRLNELQSQHSAIATLMTLHHLTDVDEFFHDAYAVLEENGILAIADLLEEDGSFHQKNPEFDGHNGFNISDLSTTAEKAGFQIISAEEYYEIRKENFAGEQASFPLFLLALQKKSL